jgi:RND family efflux transporter MFP subunit
MKRAFAILAAALLLAACEPAVEPAAEQGALVRTVEVKQGRLQHQLSFNGVLEPVTRARLAFQSPGVVSSRPVQMGQIVRRGEMLASLDNPELGPAQRAAAALLQESMTIRDQAERDLARLRSLELTGAVGKERVEQKLAELESLQAAVARAEADLTGTRQRLEDALLVAPFDGVISAVVIESGEFVSAGQPVMAIGGLDRVEVRVLLPASLVKELRVGDHLPVNIPQLKNLEASGTVTELSAIGEVGTGLFPVTVELPTETSSGVLLAGMQAAVRVDYADVEGLIVPLSAIVDPVGGDPNIFTVSDGRAVQNEVRILAIANGEVALEVLAGQVSAGDRVVVAGHRSLTDGQEVRML